MTGPSNNILICGVNWLGDVCMALPAIRQFHENCACDITILTKPAVKALWEMSPDISRTIILDSSMSGMVKTAAKVKKATFHTAYILPNSWRSALIPYMAGVPRRIGYPGHNRRILLTECVTPAPLARHQQWEFADILRLNCKTLPPPRLEIPPDALETIPNLLKPLGRQPLVGILPGAARGPSKQWPPKNFIDAAKLIAADFPCDFVLLGTMNEAGLCRHIAAEIGGNAISLAGKTTLPQLAATLSKCRTVICNDSGGMHLAAACGTPVTAIFGITDASKTGPLGSGHQILQPEGVTVSRSIPRDSAEARAALNRVTPSQVATAALQIIRSASDKHHENL